MPDEILSPAPSAPTPAVPTGASAPSGAPSSFSAPVDTRSALAGVSQALRTEPSPVEAAPVAPVVASESPDVPSLVAGSAWDAAAQRWRAPDGRFASEVVDASIAAPVIADAPVTEPEPTEPGPEPIRLTLPGLEARGETPLELEVTDPAIAERIQRALNDGLRRDEFNRQQASLQQERSQLREFAAVFEASPATIVQELPRETQVMLARHLMVQHWDVLAPEIDQYVVDPTQRRVADADYRVSLIEARQQATQIVQAERRAMQIEAAVDASIPETADALTVAQFKADALRDLQDLAQRGVAITPADVQQHLSRRFTLYGWQPGTTPVAAHAVPSVPPAPVPASRPAVAVARPVSAAAQTIDAQAARAAQARLQATQVARQRAAGIPGPGIGAATVVQPPPAEALQTIAGMSNWIRQQARAGT